MNNEIKVSLTIQLEGSTLVNKGFEMIPFVESHKTSKGNIRTNKGFYKHMSKEAKSASQHINITKEAYESMIKTCTPYIKYGDWQRMGKKARLEAHFKDLTDTLGGKSFTYEVLDD